MTWGDVDAARAHLAKMQGGKLPSRKVVYNMVAAGMRVVRLDDDDARDAKGRRRACRMRFAAEWIDEFLLSRASEPESAIRRVS